MELHPGGDNEALRALHPSESFLLRGSEIASGTCSREQFYISILGKILNLKEFIFIFRNGSILIKLSLIETACFIGGRM